mmetsp:Transcript_84878/g.263607  ORF Transcript_84878/g.263607 Transcript_84878/m.263607 type:complete len:221 (+) Transcript_84878:771-1433(+)
MSSSRPSEHSSHAGLVIEVAEHRPRTLHCADRVGVPPRQKVRLHGKLPRGPLARPVAEAPEQRSGSLGSGYRVRGIAPEKVGAGGDELCLRRAALLVHPPEEALRLRGRRHGRVQLPGLQLHLRGRQNQRRLPPPQDLQRPLARSPDARQPLLCRGRSLTNLAQRDHGIDDRAHCVCLSYSVPAPLEARKRSVCPPQRLITRSLLNATSALLQEAAWIPV